ncbi:HD domain-containing protein [Streptomyces sp. NBC_01235]|uniref:HD domain-containing protein n=1 Tax=Streptomyces sp. NBC_01235 TaxID=2903788 RepID=UPI002E10EF78|nr:ATP-binding protein [Streptomyces sp. NBC_01235]
MVQPSESARPELWFKAFGPDAYPDSALARDRFKQALVDMEARASQLASEIERDLPDFTQHDITHAHALWEIANHIAGPELTLNPAEAFVLGGAILVHDLAMSRAAYQVSGQNIRARREWPDALAEEIRKHKGRPPHPAELASPPEELATKADAFLLRALHAEVAETLPTASWVTLDKSTAYLINDPEIRQAYGRIIGRVAASHHWSSDEVTKNLSAPVGAPAFAPIEWRVDTLISACLLRTADAAHLDASRVPDLLAAVRNIAPGSKDHWIFQSRIQRPYLKSGRLVFTAPDGFAADEMGAWWLAYETLSSVDEELRNTDSMLSDNGRSTLSARGVAHVESPRAFSVVAPCRDWEPVEAKVRVGDVAGLVRRLGGNELYGDNWTVGLREIVMNACDAVKAREALAAYRGGRPFQGRVNVWLEEHDAEIWLVCSDNGIGMTPSILGGKLLDFGSTSWLSVDVVRENPGLLASKFEPTGRYGIGFFSVFMMGKTVQVISRATSGGPADSWVLEFSHGVEHRPILRKAQVDEQLDEPGTTLKVRLDDGICTGEGDSRRVSFFTRIDRSIWESKEHISPITLLKYLMPASQVDLWVSNYIGGPEAECVVSKHDWITMDGTKLLRRIYALPESGFTSDEQYEETDNEDSWFSKEYTDEIANKMGNRLEVVLDEEGKPAGRIALFAPEMMDDDFTYPTASVVTAGPARTGTSLSSTAGIMLGKPYGAARETALPIAGYSSMGAWVDSQITTLSDLTKGRADGWSTVLAEMAWRLGRDAYPLRCWLTKAGWLNYPELTAWISEREVFYVTEPHNLQIGVGAKNHLADVKDNILSFPESRRFYLTGNAFHLNWPGGHVSDLRGGFIHAFVKSINEVWGSDIESAYRIFRQSNVQFVEVGEFRGQAVVAPTYKVSRNSNQP